MRKRLILIFCFFMALAAWPAKAEIAPTDLNPLYIYVGSVEDGGWHKALEAGRVLTDKMFPGVESKFLQNLPEGAEFMIQVEKLIKSCHPRLVIASSYGYGDFLPILANKYPQVYFVHLTGYNTAPNLASAFGRMYQMRYLSGIIAGMTTKSNQIGYVAAYPVAEIFRGINAFTLGVRKVNPEATVYVSWLNSWGDLNKEEAYTYRLIDQMNCDVITMHTDTTAIAQVCERRGVGFIGYSSNMREFAPTQFLVASLWNWEVVFSHYYKMVMRGDFNQEYYYPDLSSGAISLSEYGPRVSEEAKALVAGEMDKLRVQDDIFIGPIKDNQGRLVLKDGEKITLQQLQTMNWLIEGVQELESNR